LYFRVIAAVALMASTSAAFADEIGDAIDQARKSYQSGDLGNAKQSLDLASQLVAQKNAERFAALMPAPLSGWKAEDAETAAGGGYGFGGSTASRTYTNAKDEQVNLKITGDSALISQYAAIIANPMIAGMAGKIVLIGKERAIQDKNGDLNMIVVNKYLITVDGSGPAAAKLSYAQAIDLAKLAKL
jgi:hypothetical protein